MPGPTVEAISGLDSLAPYTTKDPKHWTGRLWTLDGWTGATTGQMAVLVRVPSDSPPAPPGAAKVLALPTGDDWQTYEIDLATFRAWLTEGIPDPLPTCGECRGAKVSACETCHGVMEHECSCGDIHACAECDGKGKAECSTCHGEGRFLSGTRYYAHLGSLKIDRRLFAPLAHLGGERATLTTHRTNGETPAHLSTSNWRLVVMPLRPTTGVPGDAPRFPVTA